MRLKDIIEGLPNEQELFIFNRVGGLSNTIDEEGKVYPVIYPNPIKSGQKIYNNSKKTIKSVEIYDLNGG
ncbi:MAG: T9SS type A sorting domain-containing protein [Saprospiraceae bacterium]